MSVTPASHPQPLSVIVRPVRMSVISRESGQALVRSHAPRTVVSVVRERTLIRAGVGGSRGPQGDPGADGVGLPQIFAGETPAVDYPALAIVDAGDGFYELLFNQP